MFGGANIGYSRSMMISVNRRVLKPCLQTLKQPHSSNSFMKSIQLEPKIEKTDVPQKFIPNKINGKGLQIQRNTMCIHTPLASRNQFLFEPKAVTESAQLEIGQYSTIRNMSSMETKTPLGIDDKDKIPKHQNEELKKTEITKDWLIDNEMTISKFADNLYQRFMKLEIATVGILLDWAKNKQQEKIEEALGGGPGAKVYAFLKSKFPDEMKPAAVVTSTTRK